MAPLTPLQLRNLSAGISDDLLDPVRLRRRLELLPPPQARPAMANFEPWRGYAGTVMVIAGRGFAAERRDHHVAVGGRAGLVVESTADRLLVITHARTLTGPVKVRLGTATAAGPRDFEVLPWPKPGAGDADGPPYSYPGAGTGRL